MGRLTCAGLIWKIRGMRGAMRCGCGAVLYCADERMPRECGYYVATAETISVIENGSRTERYCCCSRARHATTCQTSFARLALVHPTGAFLRERLRKRDKKTTTTMTHLVPPDIIFFERFHFAM